MFLVTSARMQENMKTKSFQIACADNIKQTREKEMEYQIIIQINEEQMANCGSHEQSREVAESQSIEILKRHEDVALRDTV